MAVGQNRSMTVRPRASTNLSIKYMRMRGKLDQREVVDNARDTPAAAERLPNRRIEAGGDQAPWPAAVELAGPEERVAEDGGTKPQQ